ncbi:lactococcin 972 family bacteriocin [Streptomyces sp. NRRL WC-3742]|uniref:lactococcin 972 family bacteriocin n=1 Tax=Streptomyces sp. NRRL WC-3742 TaxID=1463934 RepID=UPI00068AFF88|nr:lactococcin 972 family bacteriocin [Streptomyces sp. NRRL WC-3742]
MVTLTIDPSAKTPSLASTVNVGGGTWNYGTEPNGGFKGCYSQYTHPSKYHSSTAIIASSNDKGYANAGSWSYAYATAGWAYTCNVYWGTY